MSGFIRTIEDDDEIDVNESESEDEEVKYVSQGGIFCNKCFFVCFTTVSS